MSSKEIQDLLYPLGESHIKSALHRNDINRGHGTAVSLQLMGYGHSKSRVLGIIPMQPETISFGLQARRQTSS